MVEQYLQTLLEVNRTSRAVLSAPPLSFLLAIIVGGAYLIKYRVKIKTERSVLFGCVLVCLSALGFLPSLAVILLCFDAKACELAKIDPRAIFAGGLTLFLAAIHGLLKNYDQS